VGKTYVDDVLNVAAKDNAYHPVQKYLTGLVWNGEDHLTAFLDHLTGDSETVTYANGTSQPLWRLLFSRWLLGCVARALDGDKENPFKAKKAMDKEDDKDEVAKSLSDLAKGNPTLEAGFEMTDFLKEMVDTISKSQSNLEARIARHVDARIGSLVTMNKSLGDALAGVGDATVYTANKISQFENGPARGVKSVVQAAEPVSKGGFGGGQTGLEGLSKSQIADCLANLMMSKSYNVTAQDVLKFESTGNLTPALRDAVVASRRA